MRLLFRAIHARFHCCFRNFHPLNSRIELTRWIVLQKARGHPTSLPLVNLRLTTYNEQRDAYFALVVGYELSVVS